jgi:hypothetical protein
VRSGPAAVELAFSCGIALENAAAPFEEMIDPALDIRIKATYAIFEMAPTTLAGIRAKIDFAMSAQYVTQCLTSTDTDKPLRDFLDTFYEAMRQMAMRL